MEALETRRVVLAGIREARLDLFLLLNEGAGYEVAAVVESSTAGESSRIAEILGVRVYQEHDADSLPAADLLIYGDQRYHFLGERMGLTPDRVWGEDEAWANLTEADRESVGDGMADRQETPQPTPPPAPEPTPAEAAPAFGSHLEEVVRGTPEGEPSAHAPSSEYPSVSVPELRTHPVDEEAYPIETPVASPALSDTEPPAEPMPFPERRDPFPIPEPEAADLRDAAPATDPAPVPEPEPELVAPEPEFVAAEREPVAEVPRPLAREEKKLTGSHRTDPLVLLRDFARAGHGMESFYEWVLGHAMKLTDAAAGGLAPHEPVRPYVWNDRRATPRGDRPAFLKASTERESEFQTFAFGEPGSPGAARLILVGAEPGAGADLPTFLGAVAPALRTVAELEDLRRESAWGGVVRRLVDGLAHAEVPDHALTETCRELAALLGARECTLLFRRPEGDMFHGVSSSGHRIDVPAESGLFGGADAADDRPVRLVDDAGTLHYRVPFGNVERRGVLGLFGVGAAPGAVESIGHQAVAMAQALADHFPESAWG